MEIKGTGEMAKVEVLTKQAEPAKANMPEKEGEIVKTDNEMTAKTIIRDADGSEKQNASAKGDQYISSEKELHDASGLYSVSRKSDGGMEIKFDDIKLEQKRNSLKQQILRLKASQTPEDRNKTEELKKKLANVEKKIRMEKRK